MNFPFYSKRFPNQLEKSLIKSTHLGVVAHADDLEIACAHGILEGQKSGQDFLGVVCTDGSGGGRIPPTEKKQAPVLTLSELRWQEQVRAAEVGDYAGVVGFGFASSQIKSGLHPAFLESLKEILKLSQSQFIYTHNPFDEHPTHRAVFHHLLQALRSVSHRPRHFYGVEVWRALDWLPGQRRVALPIENPSLAMDLLACHRSQLIDKNFLAATLGRWTANATYLDTQKDLQAGAAALALDLMPLLEDPQLTVQDFLNGHLKSFQEQIDQEHRPFVGEFL